MLRQFGFQIGNLTTVAVHNVFDLFFLAVEFFFRVRDLYLEGTLFARFGIEFFLQFLRFQRLCRFDFESTFSQFVLELVYTSLEGVLFHQVFAEAGL